MLAFANNHPASAEQKNLRLILKATDCVMLRVESAFISSSRVFEKDSGWRVKTVRVCGPFLVFGLPLPRIIHGFRTSLALK